MRGRKRARKEGRKEGSRLTRSKSSAASSADPTSAASHFFIVVLAHSVRFATSIISSSFSNQLHDAQRSFLSVAQVGGHRGEGEEEEEEEEEEGKIF